MKFKEKISLLGFSEDKDQGLLYGYANGNHELVLLPQSHEESFIISFVSVYGQPALKDQLWFLLKDKHKLIVEDLETKLDIFDQDDYKVRVSATLYNEDGLDEMLSISLMIEGVFDLDSIEKLLPLLKDYYKQYGDEVDQRVDSILFGD